MKHLFFIALILMLSVKTYSQSSLSEKKSVKKEVQIKYLKKSQIITSTDPRYLKHRDTQTIKQLDSSKITETSEAFQKKTGEALILKPSAIIDTK